MKKGASENLFVSIDVGTSKICVLIAQQIGPDELEIIGIGHAPSHGLARGVVVDISQAVESIKTALSEAKLMAGCSPEEAFVGISGAHIQSRNSQGVIPIKKGSVDHADIQNVLAAAQAIPIAEGHHILHVLPQYYIIDDHHTVKDPLGMHGVRLEGQAHIVTGSISSVNNLIKCCEMAGIRVKDIVLEPLASGHAVLSEDERELGVALLDIGAGTSDLAIYYQGSMRFTKILPIAGNHFTNDIAICTRITLKEAERIKRTYGVAQRALVEENVSIEGEMVQGEDMRIIESLFLAEILESRLSELLKLVNNELSSASVQPMATSGIVFTGGGALLKGLSPLAKQTLQIPSRIGFPKVPSLFKESLESPKYATAYGILIYALHKNNKLYLERISGTLVHKIVGRMKMWVADFF
jgi:cell division protein FtsA